MRLVIDGDVQSAAVSALSVESLRRAASAALDIHYDDGRELADLRRTGAPHEIAHAVAAVYNLAAVTGNGPTAAVQAAAGVSKSTAIRMVRDAREQGAELVDRPTRLGGPTVPVEITLEP